MHNNQNHQPGFNQAPPSYNPQPGYQNADQFEKKFAAPKALPSLKPTKESDPAADATLIHKAFSGIGSDWEVIMKVLTHRTSVQRQKLKEAYWNCFQKSLIERTKQEFTDPLEHIAVALEHGGPDMDAYLLHKAITGLGTDEAALINILCTRSGAQIKAINESYKRLFKTTLLSDVKSDASGKFEDLLCHLITIPREDNKIADTKLADKHVSELYTRKSIQMSLPESLIPIFGTCSNDQIRLTMKRFQETNSKPLADWIQEHKGGYYEKALLAICHFVENPIRYFSTHLKKGIDKVNFTTVIRVICTRCEVDLATILQDYQVTNKSTAEEDISRVFESKHKKAVASLKMLMGCIQ
uniref:Annexin n=1 Tax=Myxobolus squamalis TaxID=59785 RepID=A0A6B2G4I2_MYXSQ